MCMQIFILVFTARLPIRKFYKLKILPIYKKVCISVYLCKYSRAFYHSLKSLPIDEWENETIVLLQVILVTSEINRFFICFCPSALIDFWVAT